MQQTVLLITGAGTRGSGVQIGSPWKFTWGQTWNFDPTIFFWKEIFSGTQVGLAPVPFLPGRPVFQPVCPGGTFAGTLYVPFFEHQYTRPIAVVLF